MKLARWKSQYLSLGGRLTLINSVLDALPTYMMSLFPIPPGVINRLDSIRRVFVARKQGKEGVPLSQMEKREFDEEGDYTVFKMFFCGETAETVNHLFIQCKVTGQLWSLFLRLKNISWVMPGRIAEALYSWEEAGLQAKNRGNWRIIPATIWWTVWKERNLRVFEIRESNMQQLVELLAEVEEYNIDENKTDAMRWGSKGTFTVKECYRQHGTHYQEECPVSKQVLSMFGKEGNYKSFAIALHSSHRSLKQNFLLKWVMPQTLKEAHWNRSLWRVDKAIKRIWRMIPAAIF
ncbi:hypothetical protein MTR67_026381 [Solanum verrucosum]|uniref:Reverse transcriptase zinc-binding domain-containing protein n=1 Tax=Solanum verrucosum TaxID=315347 RepID=A0AAF0R722_SOLVR|nr:hypothetical protein MTR67_026381 [Solanum verrucosum]